MTKKQRKLDATTARLLKVFEGVNTDGFCKYCGKPIVPAEFQDQESIKENHISGLCQFCQDTVFDGGVIVSFLGTRKEDGTWEAA
jgi:hypothetical protein